MKPNVHLSVTVYAWRTSKGNDDGYSSMTEPTDSVMQNVFFVSWEYNRSWKRHKLCSSAMTCFYSK